MRRLSYKLMILGLFFVYLIGKIYRILLIILVFLALFFAKNTFSEKKNTESDSTFSKLAYNLEDIKILFAKTYSFEKNEDESLEVFDSLGNKLGKILCTSPLCDSIIGYNGKVPFLIAVDNSEKIVGLRLLKNTETPSFIRKIEKTGFFTRWNGKTVSEALNFQVDAVTGATFTTKVVIESLKIRLSKYKNQKFEKKFDYLTLIKNLSLILVIIFALLSFFKMFPSQIYHRLRIILLIINVLVVGFWLGNFISLELIAKTAKNGISLPSQIVVAMLLLLSFILPLVTGKAFYCTHICPFGACQDLAGKIYKHKIRVPKNILSILPFVIFFTLIFLIFIGINFDISQVEPFTAFIFQSASIFAIIFASIFIILSIFIPRFWCRYFCPTGFFLELFRKSLRKT